MVLAMYTGADPGIFRRGGQLYSIRHIHTGKRVLNADGIPHLPLCLTVSNELINKIINCYAKIVYLLKYLVSGLMAAALFIATNSESACAHAQFTQWSSSKEIVIAFQLIACTRIAYQPTNQGVVSLLSYTWRSKMLK